MPTRPKRTRPTSHQRGYTTNHQRIVAQAISHQPWCHTPRCPHPDAGTDTNPLTGHHPDTHRAFGPWEFTHPDEVVVLCRRCNASEGG